MKAPLPAELIPVAEPLTELALIVPLLFVAPALETDTDMLSPIAEPLCALALITPAFVTVLLVILNAIPEAVAVPVDVAVIDPVAVLVMVLVKLPKDIPILLLVPPDAAKVPSLVIVLELDPLLTVFDITLELEPVFCELNVTLAGIVKFPALLNNIILAVVVVGDAVIVLGVAGTEFKIDTLPVFIA